MGNRAVITIYTEKREDVAESQELGVYLHWNGGMDSINAFLAYCRMKGYRPPETDNYGWACLAKVIANYFSDGYSCGIDKCCNLDCDNRDNGVYLIKLWRVVGRQYNRGPEQDNHDLFEMMCDIDEAQPKKQQVGEQAIRDFLERKKADEFPDFDYV